jgi:hypothetical protein
MWQASVPPLKCNSGGQNEFYIQIDDSDGFAVFDHQLRHPKGQHQPGKSQSHPKYEK